MDYKELLGEALHYAMLGSPTKGGDAVSELVTKVRLQAFGAGVYAGRKEVVNFIGGYDKPFPNQRDWHAKLKDWGMEDIATYCTKG